MSTVQTSVTHPRGESVTVSRRFRTPPHRVFAAWLDPEQVACFFMGAPNGTMLTSALDPRVGGQFRFVDRRDEDEIEHVGEFLEIDRPRRLVFTFAVPKLWPGTTCVAIDITPLEGGCELRLVHDRVEQGYAGASEAGWQFVLDRLAATVTS